MSLKKIYKILLHSQAAKEIKNLPENIQKKVKRVIDTLQKEPIPLAASKLQGRIGSYRIRLGDYRIIYEVHVTEIIIYIVGVAHRKEVYKTILRRQSQ